MLSPVQLYCWHFMSYPHLPDDFDETQETGWVKVPHTLRGRLRLEADSAIAPHFKGMEVKMQLELTK